MNLKKIITLTTLVLLAMVVSLMLTDAMNVGQGILAIGAIQLVAFAVSPPRAALFTSALSPAQVQEFESIIRELSSYKDLFPSLKDLGNMPGGFAAIKAIPKVLDDLRTDLNACRRASLRQLSNSAPIPGQVSDECAEYLGGLAIVAAEKQHKLGLSEASQRESLLARRDAIFGSHGRAALTTSDIPLPTEFSGEVVQLVNMYGSARRYGIVFPLGTGTVKLPRLKTDTAFGLIASSATVTEKSPAIEFVTFTPEKYGGLVRLPSEISEDSVVAIGRFVADYAARNIAMAEDKLFWIGNGTTDGDPEGLTISTITNSKVTQMASTKTHYSDATLANFRTLRTVPDASALRRGAYYLHPSFEALLAGFNTAGDRPYNPLAQLDNPSAAQPFKLGPTLDGFPIRWIDIMPAFSTSVNVSKVFALFGDASYQYLGLRGGIRFDTSMEAAFETDEILIRALERFTIGLMAVGAMAGLETAAS